MKRRLGDMVREAGVISPQQLQQALKVQEQSGKRLGEILVALGFVSDVDVARFLAEQRGIPFLPAEQLTVNRAAARLLSEEAARRYRAVPIALEGDSLVVAMADPLDVLALDDISALTGRPVRAAAVTEQGIERALALAYRVPGPPQAGPQAEGPGRPAAGAPAMAARPARPEPGGQPAADADSAPVIRLANTIIERAIQERASDVHLEPLEDSARVRYRIDGVLREVMTVPPETHPALVSRLKLMAEMDISERRAPQDGHFRLRRDGIDIDLRVATLPTIYGEKVAMRLLDKGRVITALDGLGMAPATLELYRRLIRAPFGLLLASGPTGSGKTTTLLATLTALNDPAKNVVTIEDPVEYEVAGVNHTQVNERAGYTFARGLRAIVRQDPNIIMVGEIRDPDTADTAVGAALTGHLVLSTIHTNDAAGAVARLLDMGVEPFLIASALVGVVGQRLVRVLCPRCRSPEDLDPDAPERFALGLGKGRVTVYRAIGCPGCGGQGYHGRTGLFEVLAVNARLRSLIDQRVSADALREAAIAEGMAPLLKDGVDKALAGITSLEEVRRAAFREA